MNKNAVRILVMFLCVASQSGCDVSGFEMSGTGVTNGGLTAQLEVTRHASIEYFVNLWDVNSVGFYHYELHSVDRVQRIETRNIENRRIFNGETLANFVRQECPECSIYTLHIADVQDAVMGVLDIPGGAWISHAAVLVQTGEIAYFQSTCESQDRAICMSRMNDIVYSIFNHLYSAMGFRH